MWEILTSPSAGSIERLKASEGLLLADSWGAADIGTWARLVEQADDPYLLKNYVLIGGRAFRDSALNHLSRLCETHDHPVVLDAVDYVMTSRGKSLTSEHEPGILLPYYSKRYPVAESDTKEVESP
jgi:hypothetical protein